MRFIRNEELIELAEKKILLFVVPKEEHAEKILEILKKVNKNLEEEGEDFRIKVVEDPKIFEDEEALMDKIPAIFMLEEEYSAGEEKSGLIKLIPLGSREDIIEGKEALNLDLIKWTAWKLWKMKMGEEEAIEKANEEVGDLLGSS